MSNIDALRILYRDITGLSAPTNLRKRMMERLIEWHLHCMRNDIDSKEAFFYRRASIEGVNFANGNGSNREVFIREWNGKVHIVKQCANGDFRYGKRTFPSLTRVAKEITGGHRSGPAFFQKSWRGEF
ncbi:DUF2924 domain-containing protein [Mesorhizobium sp. BR1-1-2]|uniref:DUF2924 domain-containing protein n=1 Tax=Mesorhizobium sp. BR1-1-2 TaxID=2876652 RepID=UPI001CCEBF94|nr:DUF2924 domain-containing protein [Mesorhizobium sp. BR1-1-2]